jgi:hypothetical protein
MAPIAIAGKGFYICSSCKYRFADGVAPEAFGGAENSAGAYSAKAPAPLNGVETVAALNMEVHHYDALDWKRFARENGTLAEMIRLKLPLTRKTWLALAYGADKPKTWTHEDEAELPEPFQYAEA